MQCLLVNAIQMSTHDISVCKNKKNKTNKNIAQASFDKALMSFFKSVPLV